MNDYLDKSKEVIVYRTNKIVDILKENAKADSCVSLRGGT